MDYREEKIGRRGLLATAGSLAIWAPSAKAGADTRETPQSLTALARSIDRLRSPTGGEMVGFQQDLPSAVALDAQTKIRQVLELKDTGASGLNTSTDYVKVQALFDEVTPGSTVSGVRGTAATTAYKATATAFEISRATDINLDRGIDIRVDQAMGQFIDALSVNVQLTDGEVSPSTSGEFRGGWFRGGRVFTYNTTTATTDNLAGGYGIDVGGATAKPTIGLTLEKMVLGGGLGAVRFTSAGGSELQWCQIIRSSLTNGITFNAEDGEIAVDCVSSGLNTGITYDLTYGAYCCGYLRGTIANDDGAIDIKDGSFIKNHEVQIEHRSTDPGGSGLPDGGHVIARGLTYTGQGNELIGCNFGAGAYITNTVSLYNQRSFKIYRCQWNIAGPAGVSADLLLHRDASSPDEDASDVILGYDQNFRGARALQAVGAMTDVSRRMVISHTGGALRQPHRGIWFPLFSLLTSPAAGLTDGGLECMIDHSGGIRFNGKMTRAPGFSNGMSLCTFPTWLLPMAQQSFPVMGNGGAMTEAILTTGGFLMINGAQLAACTEIWLPNLAWNVVVNRNYVTVR